MPPHPTTLDPTNPTPHHPVPHTPSPSPSHPATLSPHPVAPSAPPHHSPPHQPPTAAAHTPPWHFKELRGAQLEARDEQAPKGLKKFSPLPPSIALEQARIAWRQQPEKLLTAVPRYSAHSLHRTAAFKPAVGVSESAWKASIRAAAVHKVRGTGAAVAPHGGGRAPLCIPAVRCSSACVAPSRLTEPCSDNRSARTCAP